MSRRAGRPRVLVLSRNYPSAPLPTRGLWARRLARAAAATCDVTVVAPVPYVPPGITWRELGRYRRIPAHVRGEDGIDVWHPRVPAGHAHLLHAWEAPLSRAALRRLVGRLHAAQRFDLIHAHFIYPDGVLAADLGRALGIPVVTSEHAFWRPWLDVQPRVWRQVQRALPDIHTVTGVSEAVRAQCATMIAGRTRTAVLPNVVDDVTFAARSDGDERAAEELLFVGLIRRVKGLDLLVRAVAMLAADRPALTLRVVGEGFFRGYRDDEAEVRRLVDTLGLGDRVRFEGTAEPAAVARAMRRAAVVVVPSRRESFCSVVVEAMASGTPVVATRCGGPEELVTPETGLLVPPENPGALAAAIAQVLDAPSRFDAARLRSHAVESYGHAAAATRLAALYGAVLGDAALEGAAFRIERDTRQPSATHGEPGTRTGRTDTLQHSLR